MSSLKVNAFTFLRDAGMFRDHFKQNVLEADVMPWLLKNTEKFVSEMGSHNNYPDTLIGNYVMTS